MYIISLMLKVKTVHYLFIYLFIIVTGNTVHYALATVSTEGN